MTKKEAIEAGATLVGAEKVSRGWVYYAEEIGARVLISSASLALAGEMKEGGEWDYSLWCAVTHSRQLRG